MASAGLDWALANGISQEKFNENIINAYNDAQAKGLSDAQIESTMNQYGISATDVANAFRVPVESVQTRLDAATPTTAAEIAFNNAAMAELAGRQGQWNTQQATNVTNWTAQQKANEAAWAEQQRLNAINNAKQIAANELAWAEKQRQNALDWAKSQAGAKQLEAAPVGQFRELFPSFAESKRLAGEMVAGRPTTQSIVDMIQGGNISPTYRPPPVNTMPTGLMDAWKTAETSGNYGDVANMLKGLNANDLRNYGASAADIAYITSRPQIAGMFPTATPVATPSLNNVLSMIGK